MLNCEPGGGGNQDPGEPPGKPAQPDFLRLGIRAPNETFAQCMERNASHYSFAGLLDLGFGTEFSPNVLGSAVLGNTFTGLYYSFAGSTTPFNQIATGVSFAPNIVSSAMGSTLTYGRRTASIMSLNVSGKGGLPRALSSASGATKGLINTLGYFKLAADASFTIAEAAGCLGPL